MPGAKRQLWLLCGVLWLLPDGIAAAPSFHIFGPSPQSTSVFGVSLSDDGRIAGVASTTPGVSGGAQRFDIATGASTLLGLGTAATTPALSADGSIAMGTVFNSFVVSTYRYASGTVTTAPIVGEFVDAVSDDGTRYTGRATAGGTPTLQAFVATWAPGLPVLTPLGDLAGGGFESAGRAISSDGQTVVGYGTQALGKEAMRWDAVNGLVGLGDLAGGAFHSEANDLSADGTTIVGFGTSALGSEAALWDGTSAIPLGDLPGGAFSSMALGVSGGGSVVVGSGTTAESTAFIWDAANGMRDLKSVLLGYGLDVSAYTLLAATDIAADGLTIAGTGRDAAGRPLGWVAVIPEPATALLLACGLASLASKRRSLSRARPVLYFISGAARSEAQPSGDQS